MSYGGRRTIYDYARGRRGAGNRRVDGLDYELAALARNDSPLFALARASGSRHGRIEDWRIANCGLDPFPADEAGSEDFGSCHGLAREHGGESRRVHDLGGLISDLQEHP